VEIVGEKQGAGWEHTGDAGAGNVVNTASGRIQQISGDAPFFIEALTGHIWSNKVDADRLIPSEVKSRGPK